MPVDHTAPTRRVRFPSTPANPPGALQLLVLDSDPPEPIEVSTAVATVGRSSHADHRVHHRSISAVHFELRALEQGVEVRDLGSTNGLWFGDRRVDAVVLQAGDQFRAGRCRFELTAVERRSVELVAADKYGWLYGASVAMREVYTQIEDFGPTPLGVVVLGETGTGKELVARTLHAVSGRSGPLVTLDCTGLTPSLAEAKLFGVRKGAFTGAEHDRVGVFEAADRGTLFLDEVGELPPPMQARLLRAVETGTITRVGEATPSASVDVRVIAATNVDLAEAVAHGHFRVDLYHRLAKVSIHLPRLRDRGEDIALLARHFLTELGHARGGAPELSEAAIAALHQYAWPGNVRELRNVIERAAYVQREGPIEPAALRLGVGRASSPDRLQSMIDAGESHAAIHARIDELLMARMVERHGTNVSAIARALGLSRDKARKMLVAAGLYGPS